MVTKGHRRLGRTIRKLESSVEFSPKENQAKKSEKQYKERMDTIKKQNSHPEEPAIQDLRELANRRKNQNYSSN
jgi:uncharacterized membrane protein YgaE (UPF0421/DUF939 family)